MKDDKVLGIKILEFLEENMKVINTVPILEGYTQSQVATQSYLLKQEGLIDGPDISSHDCINVVMPLELTPKGRRYLESHRKK